MDGVSDELLLELAEKIGYASNVQILALKLGFTLSDTDTFVETNKLNGRVTSEGTLQMLRRWRDKTPTSNQRNVLKTALENAQLSELADIHFNQSRTNGGQGEEHTRKGFRSELSDTTEERDAIVTEEVHPFIILNPFLNPLILNPFINPLEREMVERKKEITKETLMTGKTPCNRSRIMVIGPAGVGKTSLIRRLTGQDFNPAENSTKGTEQNTVSKSAVSSWKIVGNEKDATVEVAESISSCEHQTMKEKLERDNEEQHVAGSSDQYDSSVWSGVWSGVWSVWSGVWSVWMWSARKDFRPSLRRQNGHQHDSSLSPLENSRHDIFTAQLARKQLRRIAVSHDSPGESTALCQSLANDWATQNRSSRLSEKQFLFELSRSDIRPNQTIEDADQLYYDDGLQLYARNAKWSTERQRALIHNTECNEMKAMNITTNSSVSLTESSSSDTNEYGPAITVDEDQPEKKKRTSEPMRLNALVSWVSLAAWILPLLILGVMIAPATASTQFLATKSTETLNLIEGTNATIKFDRFDCPPPAVPFYTFRYLTEEQPFCCKSHDSQAIINEGLKEQGQESRFSVEGSPLNDTFSVILNISDVSVQDGGKIELVYILLNYNDHVFLKRIAEINVVKPPKKAKCHFLREEAFKHHVVRCHAPAENDTMTISCYQALSKTTPIAVYTDSDDMIRAAFLAPLDDQLQCCSHLTTENVTQETCDHSILRHLKHITPPISSTALPPVTDDPLHIYHDLSTEGFKPTSSADQDKLTGWMPLYLHVIIAVCTSFFNILM